MVDAYRCNSADDALAPFYDEAAAYRFVERQVWPNGPVCPHCGDAKRSRPLHGDSTRMGAYKCYACRKPFTVKIGTILESSNLPMHKWLQAIFLACCSDASINVGDLHRTIDVTPRTALLILRRVRQPARDRLRDHFRQMVAATPTGERRRQQAA